MECHVSSSGPLVLGIPLGFPIFGAVPMRVVVLHKRTLEVALVALGLILAARLGFSDFGLVSHLTHQWAKFANLYG